MSDLTNKISYLKGLSDGMKIAEKSEEGKIIAQLIETLEDAAAEIEEISARCDNIDEEIDELKEDNISLNMSIDELFGYMEDEDSISFGPENDEDYYDEDDDDLFESYDDEEDGLFEIMCPECGEDVIVDFDMLDEESNIVCPNCHHDIELEFEVDDDSEESEIDK